VAGALSLRRSSWQPTDIGEVIGPGTAITVRPSPRQCAAVRFPVPGKGRGRFADIKPAAESGADSNPDSVEQNRRRCRKFSGALPPLSFPSLKD
jgi:hypothetical protein